MMWNPFGHLISKNKKYPFSKVMGRSFWERLCDTHRVFMGHSSEWTDAERPFYLQMGFLDYLSLGIEPFLMSFIDYPLRQYDDESWQGILVNILAAVHGLKFMIASLLTLVFGPIVLIVHIVFMPIAKPLINEVLNLKVRRVRSSPTEEWVCDVSAKMGEVFPQERIRDLRIPHSSAVNDDVNGLYNSHDAILLKSLNPQGVLGSNVAIIEISAENEKGLEAMFKTNYFGATDAILDTDILFKELRDRDVVYKKEAFCQGLNDRNSNIYRLFASDPTCDEKQLTSLIFDAMDSPRTDALMEIQRTQDEEKSVPDEKRSLELDALNQRENDLVEDEKEYGENDPLINARPVSRLN